MAKGISMARFEDIKRLIGLGHSDRAIARTLKVRRLKVAQIRSGEAKSPCLLLARKNSDGPLWTSLLDWEWIQKELKEGHELKRIWEEKVSKITTYSNFWKHLNRKFVLRLIYRTNKTYPDPVKSFVSQNRATCSLTVGAKQGGRRWT